MCKKNISTKRRKERKLGRATLNFGTEIGKSVRLEASSIFVMSWKGLMGLMLLIQQHQSLIPLGDVSYMDFFQPSFTHNKE